MKKAYRRWSAVLLSFILAFSMSFPAMTAESSREETAAYEREEEILSSDDETGETEGSGAVTAETLPEEETTEEDPAGESTPDSEEAESPADQKEETGVLEAGAMSASSGEEETSAWLSSYTYETGADSITLKSYKGSRKDVTVPGSARVDGRLYTRIYLSPRMWGTAVTSLSFEEGVALPPDSREMFAYNPNAAEKNSLVRVDASHLDTSEAVNMDRLFCGNSLLSEVDLSGFDTSHVTSMASMFNRCWELHEVDISGFDLSRVTNISGMFFESGIWEVDLSGFETPCLTNMCGMFSMSPLRKVNFGSIDTTHVTDMSNLFSYTPIESVDLSGISTPSLTNIYSMFENCTKLKSVDLSGLNTEKVESVSAMFDGCRSLQELDLSGFCLSAVRESMSMLSGVTAVIDTPRMLPLEVELSAQAKYYDSAGNACTILPLDREDSVKIVPDGKLTITSQPLSQTLRLGAKAEFSVETSGVRTSCLWQYKKAGWQEWRDSQCTSSVFTVTAGRDWDQCSIRCNVRDYWGGEHFSSPATLTIREPLSYYTADLEGDVFSYTGSPIVPRVTLSLGNEVLTEGKDFSVNCIRNINAGTALMQISGMGLCTGTLTREYTITRADQALQLSAPSSEISVGSACALNLQGAKTVVTYTSNAPEVAEVSSAGRVTGLSEGRAVIHAAAAGDANYLEGGADLVITVTKADLSSGRIFMEKDVFAFTGAPIVPNLLVIWGSRILEEGKDYILKCFFNRDSGTARADVSGTGNFTGGLSRKFTITKLDQALSAELSESRLEAGQTARVNAQGNTGDLLFLSTDSSVARVDASGLVTAAGRGEALIRVIARATMNYNRAEIDLPVTVWEARDLSECRILLTDSIYPYTGEEICPEILVLDGSGLLKEGRDYSISVSGNIRPGRGKITLTGMGDYTGKLEKTFMITSLILDAPEITGLMQTDEGILVTWMQVFGAESYRVFYKDEYSGWKTLTDTDSTSCLWDGPAGGGTYRFTVRTIDKEGNVYTSGYDPEGKTITIEEKPAVPVVTSVFSVAQGLKIAWDGIGGNDYYRIFYREGTGRWQALADVRGRSFTWTDAVSGMNYTFTVRALNEAGTKYLSGYDGKGKSLFYVQAPVLLEPERLQEGIRIRYQASAGAGSYRIFYRINGSGWKKLADTRAGAYTWTGAEQGNRYSFTVRAMNADGTAYISGYDNTGKEILY